MFAGDYVEVLPLPLSGSLQDDGFRLGGGRAVTVKAAARPPQSKVSGLEVAGGDAVVAVELDVVEGGGYAVPAGGGSGFATLDMGAAGQDYVAVAHGPADQDDFNFDGGSDGKRAGAEKIDAGGADVASDQGDGKILGDFVDAAQAQGKFQGGAGIFAMLGMDADGVSGHASETARSFWRKRSKLGQC